jgi:hypothetical protein
MRTTTSFKETHFSQENDSLMRTNMQTDNLKVVIRVRPPLAREMEDDLPFRSIVKFYINF